MGDGKITKQQLSDGLLNYIANTGSNISFKKNSVTIPNDINNVAIGIQGYDKSTDLLMVYKNTIYLEEKLMYTISENSNYINNPNGNWEAGSLFNFIVIKKGGINGGSNTPNSGNTNFEIADGVITEAKLHQEVKNKLNDFNTNIEKNDTEIKRVNRTLTNKVTNLASQLATIDNEFDKAVANVTNGNESVTNSEVVQARANNTCLNDRFVNLESGNSIKEITFDKLKAKPTDITTYPIDNFSKWSKWSETSSDISMISQLSGGGIETNIQSRLTSNLVVSKDAVNLQGKKITLSFDITVISTPGSDDRFNLALNNDITLKVIQLKDYVVGKKTTISVDFNDNKLSTGKLSLVFKNPCKCKLENLKMQEYVDDTSYPYADFMEFVKKIQDGTLVKEMSFDKIKPKSDNTNYKNLAEFTEKVENGSIIKEITFDKIKSKATSIQYPIDNFSKWSKWSETSSDTSKIIPLENGIQVSIENSLQSNLVVSKDAVNLQGKKLTLKFDITVISTPGSDDRFNLALNNDITLKVIQLKEYPTGKPITISVDFNDNKLSTGKLSLVFKNPCKCKLENLKMQEYSVDNSGDYSSLKDVISDIKTVKEDVKVLKSNSTQVKDFILPSVIPVIKDFETNIFWDNVLLNTNIKSVERIDVGNSIGGRANVMEDRWRIMLPSNTEDITQSFNVYFNDTSKVSKSLQIPIKVLDKSLGRGKTKKIIFIGDSLTDNNVYEPELLKLFESDEMNIELLGSRGNSSAHHEGRAGWTTKHYCTESSYNDRENAFLNPSTRKFDFRYYMEQQRYGSIDYVFINMGTNDLANNNSETLTYYKEMVKSIHDFNSNIIIFIGLCPPLSSRCDKYTLKNKRIELMKMLLKEFDNKQTERIIINPLVLNFDARNGFPTKAITGTRHTNEELKVVTDDTHPLTSEYFKMADTIYCSIKYAVSLGY